MLNRAYGTIPGRHNDGVSILLMPGEQPRQPYPWQEYSACPHCGSTGLWEQNDQVGHCLKCSTWVWREMGVPWSRDTMPLYCGRRTTKAYNRTKRTVTCSTPGCNTTFLTRSYREDIYCPECREIRRKASERARGQRRTEKNRKSKLGTTADADSRSGVKALLNPMKEVCDNT